MSNITFWEQMGLSIFATLLQHLHFDSAKQSTLRNVLTPIRDALNTMYPPDKP